MAEGEKVKTQVPPLRFASVGMTHFCQKSMTQETSVVSLQFIAK